MQSFHIYRERVRTLHKSCVSFQLPQSPSRCHPCSWQLRSPCERSPPLRRLPILPLLLHYLCTINSNFGSLGPALLKQSNLVPPSASQFDPSRHTCRGDIFVAPLGLQILVRWTKTHLSVDRAPVPHPGGARPPHRPCSCLLSPPRIITYNIGRSAFTHLQSSRALHHSHSLHPVPSPVCSPTCPRLRCRPLLPPQPMQRGATVAYRQGLDQIDIKWQGLWTSDAFWQYVTSSCDATSHVATGLTHTIQATMSTTLTTSS